MKSYKFEIKEKDSFKSWIRHLNVEISNNSSTAQKIFWNIEFYLESCNSRFNPKKSYGYQEKIGTFDKWKGCLNAFFSSQNQKEHTKILKYFDDIFKLENERFYKYKDETLSTLDNELKRCQVENNIKEPKIQNCKKICEDFKKELKKHNEFLQNDSTFDKKIDSLAQNLDKHWWVIKLKLVFLEIKILKTSEKIKKFETIFWITLMKSIT